MWQDGRYYSSGYQCSDLSVHSTVSHVVYRERRPSLDMYRAVVIV